jgi:anti-sigma factor RsiW
MNRHLSTEQLSAYLDSELGFAEMRQLESHCSACGECAARLASMRRVVSGLGRVERIAPPATLRQQIRREAAMQPPPQGVRRALDTFRLLLFPVRPALHTAAVMGLALVVGLFAFIHQGPNAMAATSRPGEENVTVEPGAQSGPMTTSEVAGREFIWTKDGWIQKGLEGQKPVARVDAGSPQGRALLTKCSGLQWLLADGDPVVLRYNLETVEIHHAPPARTLGSEEAAPQPMVHALYSRSRVMEA